MWGRTTAKSSAREMPPQNSSQATENLDDGRVVKSPVCLHGEKALILLQTFVLW